MVSLCDGAVREANELLLLHRQKSLGVELKKVAWWCFQHLPLEETESGGIQALGGFFLSLILLGVVSVVTGYPAKLSKSTEQLQP